MKDAAPITRRSYWRFSLRELLLLMLAVAAFFGWGYSIFQRVRPTVPTPFASRLNLEADVVAVYQQLGETGSPWGYMMTDRSGSGRPYECFYRLNIRLPTAKSQAFVAALRQRLCDQLEANGCLLQGGGSSGLQFRQDYDRGYTQGRLRVMMTAFADPAQMFVIVREQRQSP